MSEDKKKQEDQAVEGMNHGVDIPSALPLLPVRDMVIFPYMIVPLVVGREKSVGALDEALKGDRLIFLSSQKEGEKEDPDQDDISDIGTVSGCESTVTTATDGFGGK